MACNADFVQYVADQCSGAGEIVTKKMFGDYGIYCNGVIFGLICDDHLFVKPTEAGRALLRCIDLRPPYDGAKDYFYIADVDDRHYLSELVSATCKALPKPKNKRKNWCITSESSKRCEEQGVHTCIAEGHFLDLRTISNYSQKMLVLFPSFFITLPQKI